MFIPLSNVPRDYAWGSLTAISDLLGTTPSGHPEAELWLGTHPGSPALTAGGKLSDNVTLPFLLKVLAAASPLSLQAHPTTAQAIEGFARENAAGIPLDAPHRNYRDAAHKPELIYALSERFRALCGFRQASATSAAIERLLGASPGDPALSAWLDRLGSDEEIRPTFEWLLRGGSDVDELASSLVETATLVEGDHFTLIGELATEYPGDPGIAISLMLNLTELERGQVLFLPAGNIHAYIEGLGIELMAASDNVLRGGLTPKHVDVTELLAVLDFTPIPPSLLEPEALGDGFSAYRPGIQDFELLHVSSDASLNLDSDAIMLCTSGAFSIAGATGPVSAGRGDAFFVSSDELRLDIAGTGELFIAKQPGSGAIVR